MGQPPFLKLMAFKPHSITSQYRRHPVKATTLHPTAPWLSCPKLHYQHHHPPPLLFLILLPHTKNSLHVVQWAIRARGPGSNWTYGTE
eukprot:1158617-Pelagomonas_calceolata.AAC.8